LFFAKVVNCQKVRSAARRMSSPIIFAFNFRSWPFVNPFKDERERKLREAQLEVLGIHNDMDSCIGGNQRVSEVGYTVNQDRKRRWENYHSHESEKRQRAFVDKNNCWKGDRTEFDYLIPKTELSLEEEARCMEISKRNSTEIVCMRFNADITKHCFATLNVGCWLNDEVVNAFLKLASRRGGNRKDRPHVFDSFFLPTRSRGPTGYDYSQVEKWTKNRRTRVNLFERRAVIIPINKSNVHWCLCVADIKFKKIIYYDSMGSAGEEDSRKILRYLADEHRNKLGTLLKTDDWELVAPRRKVPQQDNTNDCGVFVSYFANTLIDYFRKEPNFPPPFAIFPFTCSDMLRLRKQMKLDVDRNAVFPDRTPTR
jgi:Ulp1 family protease